MTSPIDRYEVTDHEGEKVLAVNPLEMADLLAVVAAAERCMDWWQSDGDHHGEFVDLGEALSDWGGWDD